LISFARFSKSDPSPGLKVQLSAGLKRTWQEIAAATWSEKLREVCSVLAILALASIMLFPALRGD